MRCVGNCIFAGTFLWSDSQIILKDRGLSFSPALWVYKPRPVRLTQLMETHGAGPPWRPGHQHLCSCIPVASSPCKLKLLGSGGMCMTWCRPCPLLHKVLSDFASTLAGERFAQYDPELLLPMVPYLTNASSTKNFGFPLKPLPLLSDLLRTPPYLIPQLLFSLPLPLFSLLKIAFLNCNSDHIIFSI